MKRVIALLLVLVMSLGLFAACVEETPTTGAPKVATIEEAQAYLAAMYKESPEAVLRDFDRVAVVMIDGVKFTVTWTADAAEDLVKITATETTATIDINEKPAEDFSFTLTATIKDAAGNTATTTFKHSVKAPVSTGTVFVEAPAVGVAYKWALKQNKLEGQPVLYFTGAKSGNYLATSTNPLEAVDVFVEETAGGYHMYFMDGETKKYINITTYEKDDGSLGKTQDIGTEPTCVYTWDAERMTMVAYIEALKGSYYLGTYNTYNTISSSDVKFIEDLGKIGTEQFPAGFCTINASPVEKPEVGKAYLWGLKQNKLEGQPTLYFTGAKSGNYLAASANLADAVRVYLEAVEGGYHMFFLKDGAKKYINITTYEKDDGSLGKSQDIGAEPTCVYTWDAERMTMIARIDALDSSFYLGTYNTYNTISSSDVKFIEDLGKIGTEQFPAGFYDLGLPVEEVKPDEGGDEKPFVKPTTPAAIVDAAWALEKDTTLEGGKYTLTGTIKSIDDAYSEQYKNITVTIVVDGKEDKPIVCFRLKGEGAENLAVGDVITVTGELMNYSGTVEFNSGCTFTAPAKMTPAQIVEAAWALAKDTTLEGGKYTLTGTIKSIDDAYSEQYKNITVTIVIEGCEDKPIVCFRLKGEGAENLAVGDVITVTGELMNYNGTVEFNSGCTFTK